MLSGRQQGPDRERGGTRERKRAKSIQREKRGTMLTEREEESKANPEREQCKSEPVTRGGARNTRKLQRRTSPGKRVSQ